MKGKDQDENKLVSVHGKKYGLKEFNVKMLKWLLIFFSGFMINHLQAKFSILPITVYFYLMKKILLLLLPFLLLLACGKKNPEESDPRVEALLSKMTLEEKIGQMTQINITKILIDSLLTHYDSVTTLVLDTSKAYEYITRYHVGSFLNGRAMTPEVWVEFIDGLQKLNMHHSRNKIPLLYGIDHVHGSSYLKNGTIFPHNINIAATFDTTFAFECGRITADETAGLGHRWIFSPVLDLGRNKFWGRYYETYGEDPVLVAAMGSACIRGMQNTTDADPYKVSACAKHFIGYSDPKSGWDRSPAEIPDQILREFFLPSFKAAVDAGVKTVMINSGEVNGIPVHASYRMLTTLLREELGFKGVAVTDWEDIIALVKMHYVAENEKEATFMAVEAGIDMSMTPVTTNFCDYLIELVQEGRISEERINLSVRRILKLKFDLGLFDYPYPDRERISRAGTETNRQKALDAARESLVLMKNEKNILPLAENTRNILVTGPTAHKKIPLCGGWTYKFAAKSDYWFDENMPTVFEALRKEFGRSNVTLAAKENIKEQARNADVIIVAIGEETAYAETEGSINSLDLPDHHIEITELALSTGKPVVLLLTQGRPRMIHRIFDRCDAVIFAGLPGTEGGQAIAEVISGKVNPSGKMSFTYPYKQGHIIPYNFKRSEYSILRPVGGELKRYAVMEFGEGLSYTTYSYSDLLLSDTIINGKDRITASVKVTNIGTREGKEAVLWFLTDEVGSITRPVKALKHFEKRLIAPGTTELFTFIIEPDTHLWFPDADGRKIMEPGWFTLKVGGFEGRFLLVN